MTDEADDEPYFFVTPDKDWPEAYFAIVARDEDGRGYEFCGKIVTLELAESIAAFLNRSLILRNFRTQRMIHEQTNRLSILFTRI